MEHLAKCRSIPAWAAAYTCDPSSSSWEEQASARDAAADLLVWPPRSYSCTFCRREFRSAQALGGHMNVHRRDRARLRHGDDDQAQEEQADEPHQDDYSTSTMYKQLELFRNPSTTTPSCLSTISKEKNNNKVVVSIAARDQEATDHQYDDSQDLELSERRKRRRVDQAPWVAAASPYEQGAFLDHSKVNIKPITNRSSSSLNPHVDQGEVDLFLKKQGLVDLELRLGTNPNVASHTT